MTIDTVLARLSAGLEKDEVIARAATPGPWRFNEYKGFRDPDTGKMTEAVFSGPAGKDALCIATTGPTLDGQSQEDGRHIARQDPKTTLDRVEAIRKVIAERESEQRRVDDLAAVDAPGAGDYLLGLEFALTTLAGIYTEPTEEKS